MKLAVLALPFLFAAASAEAGPPAASDAAVFASTTEQLPSAACIRPGDIENHTLGTDGRSLYLLVSGKGTYRLSMHGACLQSATRSDPVSFSAAGGSSRICKASEFAVGVGRRACTVDSIARLSAAEAKALPKDVRP
jgi:hypothetical protein